MERDGIITNALYAKFATEIKQIEEQVQLNQVLADEYYSGTINDLLKTESDYNDKLLVEDGELVYVANAVSSREEKWLESLEIRKVSDFYIVEFDSAGGTEINSQKIKSGQMANKPSNPTKAGYEFLGWYYLKESGSEDNPTYTEIEFDFDTKVTINYSLYAKYSGEAVMMARNSNFGFWDEDIRTSITSIVFTDKASLIPTSPSYTWDIRADKKKGGNVTAYLEDDGTGLGTNKLIIYSPYTIYANVASKAYFRNFTKLKKIDFSNFDTSKSQTMLGLFDGCEQLENIDLINFDTSNVKNMGIMFRNCTNLKEITNLKNFNTAKVTTMQGMFRYCTLLENLDLSSFDTNQVTSMYQMFYYCENLQTIKISESFDTKNVIKMNSMFGFCKKLQSIDLSNFNTISVRGINNMFGNCESLTELDLSSFHTEEINDMNSMFYNCKSLENLYLTNFDFSNVTLTTNMFNKINKNVNIYVKDSAAAKFIYDLKPSLNIYYKSEGEWVKYME